MGPLAALGGHSKIIALEQAPDVKLLAARRGGIWGNDHDEGPNDPHHLAGSAKRHRHDGRDRRRASSAPIPPMQRQYRVNAARQVAALTALDRELAAKLARSATGPTSSSTTPITISNRVTG